MQPRDGREAAGHAGQPLPHQHDRALGKLQCVERRRLVTGTAPDERAGGLDQARGGERRHRDDLEPGLARRLAKPQEDDRRLFLRLERDQHNGAGGLQIGVRNARAAVVGGGGVRGVADDVRTQESSFLRRARTGPKVHVSRAEHLAGELGVRVSVFRRVATAGQHRGTVPGDALGKATGGVGQRIGPGSLVLLAGLAVADQRNGQPVGLPGVFERPATLVAVPLLVDLGVVAGEAPQHAAASVVGALRAS